MHQEERTILAKLAEDPGRLFNLSEINLPDEVVLAWAKKLEEEGCLEIISARNAGGPRTPFGAKLTPAGLRRLQAG